MQKPSPVHRLLTLAALLAALPAAAAPNNITDLGTLNSDNSGRSMAFAISRDGSVVVGYTGQATAWSGSGWGTETNLGTLRSDNVGDSSAIAVSGESDTRKTTTATSAPPSGRATAGRPKPTSVQ